MMDFEGLRRLKNWAVELVGERLTRSIDDLKMDWHVPAAYRAFSSENLASHCLAQLF